MKLITKILIFLDILALICYFIFYGPISYVRDLLVTTAMTTMEHQYLAQTFYTEKMIEKVLDNNKIIESTDNTDTNQIDFEEKTVYDSIYEKDILERDKDALYKIIDITSSMYKGYLVAVYDSKRIELALASNYGSYGETLDRILINNDAILGINASGFLDDGGVGNGGSVAGILIKDGIILNNIPIYGSSGIVGFNKDGVLMLTHKKAYEAISDGLVDGVEFGPFLIINGVPSYINGNGGMGIQPRTIIAQRKDGIVLFLVIDGRQPGYSIGITIEEATKILLKYGAYNASNLDGGASTTLAVDKKIYNSPCGMLNGHLYPRALPNAWVLK